MHLNRPSAAHLFGLAALAVASVVGSPAISADIVAPATAPVAAQSWAGPYIGVSLGGRWANSTWTTTCLQPTTSNCAPPQAGFPDRLGTDNPAPFDTPALRLGGYLGYNWQIGNWVAGLEADLAWADGTGTRAGIPGTWRRSLGPGQDTATVRDTWDASLRGRIGMLIGPDKLVYVTGGVAWLSTTASASCAATFPVGWCISANSRSASGVQVLPGWTVGAGVEWRITPSVVLRGEYRYASYQGFEETFFPRQPVDTFRFEISRDTHTAYFGISYLFGAGVLTDPSAPFRGPPAGAPIAAESWTGPYLGVSLGGRWANSNWTTTCLVPAASNCTPPQATFSGRLGNDNPALFESSVLRIGGYLGYSWQIGHWVTGLEGDFAWADGTATHAGIPGTWRRSLGPGLDVTTVGNTWDASLRGRIGLLIEPNKLVYATAGVAWLRTTAGASCPATYPVGWCIVAAEMSASKVLPGWTVGGGVEWLITPNVILRGEYRYSAYQRLEETFFQRIPVDEFRFEISRDTHTAYFGISYLFGAGSY